MRRNRSKALVRFAFASVSVLALQGCAGGQGGFAPDIFGKSVPDMEGPLIETTTFAPGAPSVVGGQKPPRTFFFSGAAEDHQANYFLYEANKLPIDAASWIIPDRRIRTYLHGIAERLLEHSPPGTPEVQVHVFAGNAYTAFVRSDGDVYISIGVLAVATSEDEIATLMGHELGHLILRHHDKDELFNRQRDATSAAVLAAVTGLSVKAQLESSGSLTAVAKRDLEQDSAAVAASKLAVDFVANDVVNASWNRAQENEADLIGMDLAARAGYDPIVVVDNLTQLVEAAKERQTRLSRLSEKASERSAELELTMKSAFEAGRLDIASVFRTGFDMLGDAGAAIAADARASLARAYQSPEARIERAEEYLDRFYHDASSEIDTDYDAVRRRLGIVQLNNAYAKVGKALDAVTEKRFQEAVGLLNQSYRTARIGTHPLPRLVEAHARRGLGDRAGALRALGRVSRETPLAVEGYILKAELQAEDGSARRALATLDRGKSFYGAEAMQPARVIVLAILGRDDALHAALDECSKMSSRTQRACREVAPETEVAGSDTGSPPLGGIGGAIDNVTEGLKELF